MRRHPGLFHAGRFRARIAPHGLLHPVIAGTLASAWKIGVFSG
jgi:hypothetical protein